MRIMITDSGLGGLSVCAALERQLLEEGLGGGIQIDYVNATQDDAFGYNNLDTQAERIELFSHFLERASARVSPDVILIACNTLSVIYHETEFAQTTDIPVMGIVDAGVKLCDQALSGSPNSDLIIFATETTTEAGTYPKRITSRSGKIIPCQCPGLAHAISSDASGELARKKLAPLVAEIGKSGLTDHVFAFMGCTHYGYQAQVFVEALATSGVQASVLDPNTTLAEIFLETFLRHVHGQADTGFNVQFTSRYPIPENQVSSLEAYLHAAAPHTLSALKAQQVVPDLF